MPADLRESPGPGDMTLPFTSLYQTGDEWAAEMLHDLERRWSRRAA